MKKWTLTLVLPLLVLGIAGYTLVGADIDKETILSKALIQVLNSGHYHPLPLDDKLSERAYDLYVDRLDYQKRFLLQSDIDALSQFRLTIDDELQAGTFNLYERATAIVAKRRTEVKAYVDEILAAPFDFTVDEYLETDRDKRPYCQSSAELKDRWRKVLKYSALNRYLNMIDKREDKLRDAAESGEEVEVKTEAEFEASARAKVAENMERFFHNVGNEDEDDRFAAYVNAMARAYGPHTEYFPPAEKDNFDISMTGKLEGIGAQLMDDNGYIKVTRIVPGSASWRQGDLEAEDIILKVAQGDAEPEDVVDVDIDDAVRLIRGPKGSEVRLTVKKPAGDIIVVPIIRDVVVLEETYAKSAIIENKNEEKIGYIYLPKFYSDFRNEGGRTSSEDVRRELMKLRRDKVNGVILDLRNNGGGALQDAVKMAGLFIETGPIVQVRGKEKRPRVLTDENPGVTYDGPLVVLVNTYSASASEIVAGALKDYGRAVIVGTSPTFGKGTVQTFADMNRFIPAELTSDQPFGSLKLTIQQFYRINGESTQFKGVTPDVLLPDPYSYIEIGERSLDHALPWRATDALSYRRWQGATYYVNDLRSKSAERVEQNETFALLHENIDRLKKRRDQTRQSLNAATVQREEEEFKEQSKQYKEIDREHPDLTVYTLKADKERIDSDEDKKKEAGKWYKQIRKDVFIQEAVFILHDMITS